MIGKPEWFGPRKFGWGVGLRTKEGWAYFAVVIAAVLGISYLPVAPQLKGALSVALVALVAIDMLDVMRKVYSRLDEREQKHQLVAERNASFVAVAGFTAYVLYLAFSAQPQEITKELLPLVGLLVAMAFAKGITLIYLEREH